MKTPAACWPKPAYKKQESAQGIEHTETKHWQQLVLYKPRNGCPGTDWFEPSPTVRAPSTASPACRLRAPERTAAAHVLQEPGREVVGIAEPRHQVVLGPWSGFWGLFRHCWPVNPRKQHVRRSSQLPGGGCPPRNNIIETQAGAST